MKKFNTYGSEFSKVYDRFWKGFVNQIGPKLVKLYKNYPISKTNKIVVDLCCGTGRLIPSFIDAGYNVIGIDQSENMLELAKSKLRSEMNTGQVSLRHGFAQSFTVEKPVGLVISIFDSLNHLENLEILKCCIDLVFSSLESGGVFIFDMNTKKALSDWNFIDLEEDDDIVVMTQGKYEESESRAYTRVFGFIRSDGSLFSKFDEIMYNSLFSINNVTKLLLEAGFININFYKETNFEEKFLGDPETLDRVFISCTKF